MAYPDVSCSGEALPVGCCQRIWDQGEALLAAVFAPIQDCLVESPCCGELRSFISLGRPETWDHDFLALWLNGISFSTKTITPSGGMLLRPVIRAEWSMLLWESNYPGLVEQNDNVYAPSTEQWNAANLYAYAHGEAMLQGLLGFATSGCEAYALRGFAPATPEAYSAGWLAGVAMDIEL